MKNLLFAIGLMFSAAATFSQPFGSLNNSLSYIQYLPKGDSGSGTGIKTISVTIEYWTVKEDTSKASLNLKFKINKAAGSVYLPQLLDTTYLIPQKDITVTHKKKELNLHIQVKDADAFAKETFTIAIVSGAAPGSGTATVEFTEDDKSIADKTAYDELKPFWVELGTNLDLVDGPKLNNFTAGIFFTQYDHRWGKSKNKHWATFAGAYESKIISNENDDSKYGAQTFVNSRSFIPGLKDTIKVFDFAGKQKKTQTIRNWSFFYSPAYRLDGGQHDDGNFHIYASLWTELRYQEVRTLTDNSALILIDSSRAPLNTIDNYKQSDDTLVRSDVYTHYFGAGFPIHIESKTDRGWSFLLNPVFGATNQPGENEYELLGDDKTTKQRGNPNWRPFYLVQFRLSDKAYGITVTGEIRGLIVNNSEPQYTIALTKKFNLQKLIFYNNGKD